MGREDAIKIFEAGVHAVQPDVFLPGFIRASGDEFFLGQARYRRTAFRNIYLLAVGKAAAAMALGVEKLLPGYVTAGLVITKRGHTLPGLKWPVMEAGHPIPDQQSLLAGEQALDLVARAGAGDLLIVLLSGGASSLLADLPAGSSLDQLQRLFADLLASGASIGEMNTVRKHFSRIKGGQLAVKAFPACVHQLVLSDVKGDDLSVIGSGPFYPDPSGFQEAAAILRKYGLSDSLAFPLKQWLEAGLRGEVPEAPKAGDPVFERVTTQVVGNIGLAVKAAAAEASRLGYRVSIHEKFLEGECRETSVALLREVLSVPRDAPACIIAGGETTVTVRGSGRGGRNQEFVLAALDFLYKRGYATEKENCPVVLSGGTDGTDGPTDAAGAVMDAALLARMEELALDPAPFLENNDAWHFFRLTGGLLETGPTQTNVTDLVVILPPTGKT